MPSSQALKIQSNQPTGNVDDIPFLFLKLPTGRTSDQLTILNFISRFRKNDPESVIYRIDRNTQRKETKT